VWGPRSYSPVPDWITAYVPCTGYLCHCPELPVAFAEDADGQVWYLLGVAVQSEAGRPGPVDEITTATRDTIQELYQSWEGRWVLIGAGELHMDASGLLGCFYTRVEESGGEIDEMWVSSSAALLAEVSGADTTPVRNVSWGEGIDWYTPPRSRFESIRRLLPSQLLVLADGSVVPRRLVPELSETFEYDSILHKLREHLATVLRRASAATSGNLWLALTAGYDSRLLLAAARYADVPVKTYTLVWPGISQADLTVPRELARAVGFTHSFFSEGTFREELGAVYDQHTSGHNVDVERRWISHGLLDWSQKGDLIMRGGALAAGKANYWANFPREDSRATPPDVVTIVRGFGYEGTTEDQPLISALSEWIGWTHRTPHPEFDWRDRLYFEQRLGGWLSSIEQSLDLVDAAFLHPGNSGSYYAHLLQVPPQKRRTVQHHVDLIRSMAPELRAFPIIPFRGSGTKPPSAAELRKANETLVRRNSQLEKRNSQLKKRNSQLEERNSRLIARYSSRRYKLVDSLSEKVLQIPGAKKMVRRGRREGRPSQR
jgi:hypothetical protein